MGSADAGEHGRSLRSKGRDLWAKFQTSAESRRSIVATVRGRARRPRTRSPRNRGRRIQGRRAASGRGPCGRASADIRASRRRRRVGVSGRRRAGVGPADSTSGSSFAGGLAHLFCLRQGRGPGADHGRDRFRLAANSMAGRRRATGSTPKAGVSRCRNRRRQVVEPGKIPLIRRRSSRVPGVQCRGPRIVEIRDIAGDYDQVMDDRGRRDQAVRLVPRAKRGDPTPFEGDDVSDR